MDDDGAVKGCSTKTDDQAMYQAVTDEHDGRI